MIQDQIVISILIILLMTLSYVWYRAGKRDARVDIFVDAIKNHGYSWEVGSDGKVYIGNRHNAHCFIPTEREKRTVVQRLKLK